MVSGGLSEKMRRGMLEVASRSEDGGCSWERGWKPQLLFGCLVGGMSLLLWP